MATQADFTFCHAGLIGVAQKVEHYKMAGYGTASAHARQLGHNNAVKLLERTLDEEKAADQKLTKLAESAINTQATTD